MRVWAAVLVTLLATGCTRTSHAGVLSTPVAHASPVVSAAGALPCADPARARALTVTPAGPAAGAVTGDRVSARFGLENRFVAAPVPAGYLPPVPAAEAACELSSLYSPNGFPAPAGRLALATVTIEAAGLSNGDPLASQGGSEGLHPGPVPVYGNRTAWIWLATANNDVSSCPTSAPSDAPVPTGVQADPYEIFAIDAATGTDAVAFEDSFILCSGQLVSPPTEWIPWQQASVPWTLTSRAPDGATAQIVASWPDCERYALAGSGFVGDTSPGLHAWVDSDHPDTVRIDVDRLVGPECGPPVPHRITLHPATVGTVLPATLAHAPLGVEPATTL